MFCTRKTFRRNHSQTGFHLIEILIALSIISILTLCAIPIYSHYITQLKRLNAAHLLIKLSVSLEEYYLRHQTYEKATLALLNIPEWIDQCQLMISHATSDDYKIMAKPIYSQAKKDALCGTLILSADGEKNISGRGDVKDCW